MRLINIKLQHPLYNIAYNIRYVILGGLNVNVNSQNMIWYSNNYSIGPPIFFMAAEKPNKFCMIDLFSPKRFGCKCVTYSSLICKDNNCSCLSNIWSIVSICSAAIGWQHCNIIANHKLGLHSDYRMETLLQPNKNSIITDKYSIFMSIVTLCPFLSG